MKKVYMGGPLLGSRADSSRDLDSSRTFQPIVSEPIGDNTHQERLVLLPNARFIAVLAYRTGKRLATLLPGKDDKEDALIESVVLANGHVVLAGLRDGTLREFDLQAVLDGAQAPGGTRSYLIAGRCIRPRRTLRITEDGQSVMHLATAFVDGNLFVYAQTELSRKKTKLKTKLVRILLPTWSLPKSPRKKTVSVVDARGSLVSLDGHKYASKEASERKKLPPLDMVASVTDQTVFLLLATPGSLTVYHDRPLQESSKSLRVGLPCTGQNVLTAVAVAANGRDVACGYQKGNIDVYDNLLPMVADFHSAMQRYKKIKSEQKAKPEAVEIEKPAHPAQTAIARHLHWHAHSVASLAYDALSGNNSMLYSGGHESVLAIWQLSRGSRKPAEVLPRLALGGIVHLRSVTQSAHSPSAILIYCEDNSLQLFESHNKSLLWKIRGLAADESEEIIESRPMMRVDPSSGPGVLALTGLPRAPGLIHWYDTHQGQVVSSLEVVPFNRVSRTEHHDSPMPSPCVTHAVWNQSGSVLVTVDTVPTENSAMGSYRELPKGDGVGVVTTIRFWGRESGAAEYDLAAAMSYPHGSTNGIAALALSIDGSRACTVSNDERAFRLWERIFELDDEDETGRRKAAWHCQYKVAIPAGYSKFDVGRGAVAFSPDLSTLAIAFGTTVTLWDLQDLTLLSSLRTMEDDESPVTKLAFQTTAQLVEMLYTVSAHGVTLQSPYGDLGQKDVGWSYLVNDGAEVACSEYLPESDQIAIAVYEHASQCSSVILVDSTTGGTIDTSSKDIPNRIVALGVPPLDPMGRSAWMAPLKSEIDSHCRLYALTNRGEMIYLTARWKDSTQDTSSAEEEPVTVVPSIPLLTAMKDRPQQKRSRAVVDVGEIGVPSKKLALIGQDDGTPSGADDELPRLRGAFLRSFVGRHLKR